MALFGKSRKVAEIRERLEARPRRVLVVDDDRLFLAQLGELFAKQGWEVVGVPSAKAALERSDLGRFDVALADVIMPEMDGLSFCQKLRQTPAGSTLKIVLMSAGDPTPLRQEAERLGCAGFLTKPIDERITVETVSALVG